MAEPSKPDDSADHPDTPEAIAEYLTAAFETADLAFIAKAVGTAARARVPPSLVPPSPFRRARLRARLERRGRPGQAS